MHMLNKLTVKNLTLNKKRTIVTIIGIILSVALLTALSTLVFSFRESLIEYQIASKGNFHYGFYNVPASDLTYFENNRAIEDMYTTREIGYAKVESKNESKPYAYLLEVSNNGMDKLGFSLVQGRLPENSHEIVIPRHLKTNGRVDLKVGDTITLDIGARYSEDYVLNQDNPFNPEEEFIKESNQEYKIVGIIERPSSYIENYSAPGYTFITIMNEEVALKPCNVYIRYNKKSLKNQYQITANLLGVDEDFFVKTKGFQNIYNNDATEEEMNTLLAKVREEMELAKYDYTGNSMLLSLESNNFNDATMNMLYAVSAIVVLIIIFTSVFCIKNSFAISITEKTKQYGMLKSIGATKSQIKKNVLYEAFLLGSIGIPIGILGGILASYLLIKLSDVLLGYSLNIHLIFKISWLPILLSIILGAITIYLSAKKSAKKASKITPMVAIRDSEGIKINSKKIESPKYIDKLFGIGGKISYKNLKRDRKKYRPTIISITVCVSIFIALSSFVSLAFKVVKMEYGEKNYNLSIDLHFSDYAENKSKYDEEIDTILDNEYIKTYSIVKSKYMEIEHPNYTSAYINQEGYSSDVINQTLTINILSLNDEAFKSYLDSIKVNFDEAKNKGVLINNSIAYKMVGNRSKRYEVEILDIKKGETLDCIRMENSEVILQKEIEIAGITDKRPVGYENNYGFPILIVSEDTMNSIEPFGDFEIFVTTSNADKLQDELDNTLKDYNYHIYNVVKEAKQMQSFYTLIAIFLYGFITVIALIGITNIFNTITTNMEVRRKEFAMLKSIGMTKNEFNKMIRLESLFYGIKSLAIGIPIGIILSYLLFKALTGGEFEIKYVIPYSGIVISILVVFILLFIIMKFSIHKINKKNIIETIRNENI